MAHTTLAFIGDVMLGRGVNEMIGSEPPEYFWGDTLPVLRSADAVIANLECAISDYEGIWWRTPKVFYFRADPGAVEVLRAASVRCVTLANNHTLDYDEQGLLDTLRHLDEAGVLRTGAGRDLAEASAPAVFDAAGLGVGVLSFTDNEPSFAADADRPGTNYMEIETDPDTLGRVEVGVRRARDAGARLVALGLHWGPNMVLRPPPSFGSFASAALGRGADLIYGHSAHLFQGVQLHNDKLVMYDAGDFLDDYAIDPDLRNDWSFIFLVEADDQGIIRLRMLPVRLRFARVDLATGTEFEAICERMMELCTEFGTPVIRTSEGLEVPVRE